MLNALMAGGAHAGPPPTLVASTHGAKRVPGHYVVVLDPRASVNQAWAAAEDQPGVRVDDVYRSAIHGYAATMSATKAEAIAQMPQVQSVQPDTRVSMTAQSMPTGIDRANADLSPSA